MSKYLRATLGIAAMLIASTALARERSALESSSVKAASDCVPQPHCITPTSPRYNRENTGSRRLRTGSFSNRAPARTNSPRCACSTIGSTGAGTGRIFFLGDYLASLPRAVGDRIRGEVEKSIGSESWG